jgi:hypothetical protein
MSVTDTAKPATEKKPRASRRDPNMTRVGFDLHKDHHAALVKAAQAADRTPEDYARVLVKNAVTKDNGETAGKVAVHQK